MKLINNILVLATLITCSNCTEDNFAPVVNVDLPPHVVGITATGYVQNLLPFSINVSKSQPININQQDFNVQNPIIKFTENGVIKNGWQKVPFIDNPADSFYTLPGFVPTPGNIYELQVSANGLPTSTSIDTMPLLVNITVSKTGKTKYYVDKDNTGVQDTLTEVKISWQDDGSVKDYYRLIFSDNDTIGLGADYQFINNNKRSIFSNDLIFNLDNNADAILDPTADNAINAEENYFTDEDFNGKNKEVLIWVPTGNILNNEQEYSTFVVKLQHLSNSCYRHATSIKKYIENDGGSIFSQPVIVYKNAINGYGTLGCNTVSIKDIKLK